MPPRSKWDQDDSDDERPIYRGPRNYEGATSVIGDAWDDRSVEAAASQTRYSTFDFYLQHPNQWWPGSGPDHGIAW